MFFCFTQDSLCSKYISSSCRYFFTIAFSANAGIGSVTIDGKIYNQLALRPDYEFEIIGHSAPEDLELPANIELFGPKNHAEINEIASKWRVAIIPFKMGPLADGVDPIKIYEYMALGLPTVSFRMPQINSYPYTLTVDNVPDFCAALDEFSRHRPRKGKLNNWLETNKWSDRVDRFLALSSAESNDGIRTIGVNE